jgi:hypothetical protein
VQQAARVAMGVELRPRLKSMDEPSNPKVTAIATGAGLRATAKGVEHPPDPTMIRAAHSVVTPRVIAQQSADGVVAQRPP